MGARTVGINVFVNELRLAAKVLTSGGMPSRLKPCEEVLDELGVPAEERRRFAAADVEQQVRLLVPYAAAMREAQKQAATAAGRGRAAELVGRLRAAAHHRGGAVGLSHDVLGELSTVPVYDVLQLATGTTEWTFPRVVLANVLRSLSRLPQVEAELEGGRLVLVYVTPTGRGAFRLDSQPAVARGKDVLRVPLVTTRRETARPRPSPPVKSNRPTLADWVADLGHELVELLLAS